MHLHLETLLQTSRQFTRFKLRLRHSQVLEVLVDLRGEFAGIFWAWFSRQQSLQAPFLLS